MNIYLITKSTVLAASLAAGLCLLALPIQAADQHSGAAVPSVSQAEKLDIMAAGAVKDTLEACLARIPKDASAGQRMMAEQGCGQDQETRSSTEVAPKF